MRSDGYAGRRTDWDGWWEGGGKLDLGDPRLKRVADVKLCFYRGGGGLRRGRFLVSRGWSGWGSTYGVSYL
jgi:hypothetical protein